MATSPPPRTSTDAAGIMTADDVVTKMTEDLTCVMCGCIFVDPRMLACQHCFCLRCLFSQALHDRGSRLTIKCAFRCGQVTTTTGDIRTLPRNPIVTSMATLLRTRLKDEMTAKHKKVEQKEARQQQQTDRTPAVDGADPSPASGAEAEARVSDDSFECEWCSQNSPTCQWCPHCCSRVCAECRGYFGDHHFLCVALHEKVGSGPLGNAHARSSRGASPVSGDTPSGGAGDASDDTGASRFPFFLSQSDVLTLVHEKVVSQVSKKTKKSSPRQDARDPTSTGATAAAPASSVPPPSSSSSSDGSDSDEAAVALTDVEIMECLPARMACPLWSVACTQDATGFSATLEVQPPLHVGGLTVQVADMHWEKEDLGAEVLLFLSNMLRLANHVVRVVNSTSLQAGELLGELSSMARKDLIGRNRGFQLFATHIATVARMQVQIVRNCLLAHLVRARLVEGLMGDVTANRYAQIFSQSSVHDRQGVRQRYIAFLKVEMQLAERFDKAMHVIDALCVGVEVILTQIFRRLRHLALLKDAPVSTCAMLTRRSTTEDDNVAAAAKKCLAMRTQLKKGGGAANDTTADGAGGLAASFPSSLGHPSRAAVDPISDPFADFTFLGQVHERRDVLHIITQSLLDTLDDFFKIRHWTWTYTNTTVRSCGLSETDRNDILSSEEQIQTATDSVMHEMREFAVLLHRWEVFVVGQERGQRRWPVSVMAHCFLTPAVHFMGRGSRHEEEEVAAAAAIAHTHDSTTGDSLHLQGRSVDADEIGAGHEGDGSDDRRHVNSAARAEITSGLAGTTQLPRAVDDGTSPGEEASGGSGDMDYFSVKYTMDHMREGLSNLRMLRGYLLRVESADFLGRSRGYETQSELLNLMSGIIRSTLENQLAVLRASHAEGRATVLCAAVPMQSVCGAAAVVPAPSGGEATTTPHSFLHDTEEQAVERLASLSPRESEDPAVRDAAHRQDTFLLGDFVRRDVVMGGAAAFGHALVDAAHGVAFATEGRGERVAAPRSALSPERNQALPPPATLTTPDETMQALPESRAEAPAGPHGAGVFLVSLSLFPHRRRPSSQASHMSSSNGVAMLNDVAGEPLHLPDRDATGEETDSEERSSSVVSSVSGAADDEAPLADRRDRTRNGAALRATDGAITQRATADGGTRTTVGGALSQQLAVSQDERFDAVGNGGSVSHVALQSQIELLDSFAECLFAADNTETRVTEVRATASSRDADGSRRAATLFAQYFRLSSDQAVALHSQDQLLPFYVGLYRYRKGAGQLFVVDAQTGEAWVAKPESGRANETYSMLSTVGSTQILLFLLANVAAKFFFGTSMAAFFST